LSVTLNSSKTKVAGRVFDRFAVTRSFRSASTSQISSPSDLITPSSRFPDPLAARDVLSYGSWVISGSWISCSAGGIPAAANSSVVMSLVVLFTRAT
jgi:hypothetical protein